MSQAAIRKAKGQTTALAIYRSLLNLALLITGFDGFPDHKAFIALAVLVFSHGIGILGCLGTQRAIAQNYLDGLGEQKTRHTILLATTEWASDAGFWGEVNRRVEAESDLHDDNSSFWTEAGMVGLRLLGLAALDLVTVGVALLLAS